MSCRRVADTRSAFTRHAPLGRKSKPGISQWGYNESCATATRGAKNRNSATALKNQTTRELTKILRGGLDAWLSARNRGYCTAPATALPSLTDVANSSID